MTCVLALLLTDCITSEGVPCGDVLCGPGYACNPEGGCRLATCGNGILDPGEACDGAAPEGACQARGYYDGVAGCTSTCLVDESRCGGYCGDDTVQVLREECDTVAQWPNCTTWGFDAGSMGCAACRLDPTGCWSAGWRELSIFSAPGAEIFGVGGDLVHLAVMVGVSGKALIRDGVSWRQMETGTKETLHDVSVLSESVGWAVGGRGTILRLANEHTWVPEDSGTDVRLRKVIAISDREAFAGGNEGVLLKYDGAWSRVEEVAPPGQERITGLSSKSGVTCATTLVSWHIYDGQQWQSGVPDKSRPIGCWVEAPWRVHIFTRDERLVWTGDASVASVPTELTESTLAVYPGAESVALRTQGAFWRFDGSQWMAMNAPSTDLTVVNSAALGTGDTFMFTRSKGTAWVYGGEGWQETPFPGGNGWRTVKTDPSGTVLLAGALGAYRLPPPPRSVATTRAAGQHTLNDAAIFDDEVILVGDNGTLIVETEEGPEVVDLGTTERLMAVWGASQDDVWVAGGRNTLLRRLDHVWTPYDVPLMRDGAEGPQVRLNAVHGTSDSHVLVAGGQGTLLHFDGQSWDRLEVGVSNNLRDVHAVGESIVVAANGGLILERLGDGPFIATALGAENLVAVTWADALGFVAGDPTGAIFQKPPGGKWKSNSVPTAEGLASLYGTSDAVLATTSLGRQLRLESKDRQIVANTSGSRSRGLGGFHAAAARGNAAIVVGDFGSAYHHDGVQLTQLPTPTLEVLRTVCNDGDGAVAAGNEGVVLVYDGATWTQVDINTSVTLLACAEDASGVWLAGDEGTLLQPAGAGEWSPHAPPGPATLNAVAVHGDTVHVGGDDGAFTSHQGGPWQRLLWPDWQGITSPKRVLALYEDGERLLIGHEQGVHALIAGTWSSLVRMGQVTGFCVRSPADIFGTMKGDHIAHFDGATWSTLTVPQHFEAVVCAPGSDRVFGVGRTPVPYVYTFDSLLPTADAPGDDIGQ